MFKKRMSMNGMIKNARECLERFTDVPQNEIGSKSRDYLSKQTNDQRIPQTIIRNARGIAFLTTVKAGFIFTGSVATGIVIAKDEQGVRAAICGVHNI